MKLQVRHPNGRFGSFKKTLKHTFYIAVIISIGTATGTAYFSTSTVKAVVPDPVIVEAKAPILDRIAKCESGNSQMKDGQVLVHINTNGTYDMGVMQINSIHNKQAAALGFDLSTEAGNRGFGKWLYANKGTGDWASSSKCWMN